MAGAQKYMAKKNREERRWSLLAPMLYELETKDREKTRLSEARSLLHEYEMAKVVVQQHEYEEKIKLEKERAFENALQELELLKIKLAGLEK